MADAQSFRGIFGFEFYTLDAVYDYIRYCGEVLRCDKPNSVLDFTIIHDHLSAFHIARGLANG